MRYLVTISSNNIKIEFTEINIQGRWQMDGCPGTWIWEGTVEGLSIKGTYTRDYSCVFTNGQKFTRQMSGTISADRRKIFLKYDTVSDTGAKGRVANGFYESGSQEKTIIR